MSAETDEMDVATPGSHGEALTPGTTLLRGQYTITRFLNAGGFGITYLASDSLDRTVVLKECFPAAMCRRENGTVLVRSRSHAEDFASIVKNFGNEARRLARLQHPNIVGVHQVFEDNETSYMALDFVEGPDMLTCIDEGRAQWSHEQVTQMLLKLLDAVKYLHERDILHRDISPDNILIDPEGEPILIDFGAAREEATRQSRVLSSIHTVKDGYSPHEFYIAGSPQGAYSDLYALAATFYHLIAGEAPPDSQKRVAAVAEGRTDPYLPLSTFSSGFDSFFVNALNRALSIFAKDRLQTAEAWITEINAEKRREAALSRARADRLVEESILKIVAETNQAVLADQVAAIEEQAAPATTGDAPAVRPPRRRRKTVPLPKEPATRPRTEQPQTRPRRMPQAAPVTQNRASLVSTVLRMILPFSLGKAKR